ncbi:MAG: hypothetical protein KGQ51_18825, partial [Planctomycetes bacterium]|nr:hypothetical protein [Planctomycetota bacterium]
NFQSPGNPKLTKNKKMHPSGEVGRFQMNNISSPPGDFSRSSLQGCANDDCVIETWSCDSYCVYVRMRNYEDKTD